MDGGVWRRVSGWSVYIKWPFATHFRFYWFKGFYPALKVKFKFQRNFGHHLIQTYLPTVLIVTISWVSFFLEAGAVPARVSLGITTFLTMITLNSGAKIGLPPVSYVKVVFRNISDPDPLSSKSGIFRLSISGCWLARFSSSGKTAQKPTVWVVSTRMKRACERFWSASEIHVRAAVFRHSGIPCTDYFCLLFLRIAVLSVV